MARQEVEIYFKVEGLDGYITNLNELNSALGGVTKATDDVKQATKEVEDTTKRITESGGGLDVMEGSIKTLAGSFEILAGAASLLGVEDNEFFKSLEENVMGVLSLSQGAIDATEGIRMLAESEKLATYWQEAMNIAANANPYVLLAGAVVALTVAIAAYVVSAKDASEIANELATNTSKKARDSYAQEAAKVEVLNEQYKLAGDNLEARKEILGQLQEINPDYFGNLDAEKTSYEDLKGAVKDYNDEVYKQAVQKAFGDELIAQTANLIKLKAEFEDTAAAVGESTGLWDDATNALDLWNPALSALIGGAGEVGKLKELTDEILQTQTNIDTLNLRISNATDGFTNMGTSSGKASTKVDETKKSLDGLIEAFDTLLGEGFIYEDGKFVNLMDDLGDQTELEKDLKAYSDALQAVRDEDDEFNAAYDAGIEARIEADNKKAENDRRLRELQKQQKDEELAEIAAITLASLEAASDLAGGLQELANVRTQERLKNVEEGSAEEEAILKESFERSKKFQKAQTIINTAAAIIGALAVPKDQLTGQNWIKAAAAAALGAVQIATISAATYGGGVGSGGGGNPGASINYSFGQEAGPTIQPGQSSAGQPQPVQTYVLASDVTNAQQAQQQISNLAKL